MELIRNGGVNFDPEMILNKLQDAVTGLSGSDSSIWYFELMDWKESPENALALHFPTPQVKSEKKDFSQRQKNDGKAAALIAAALGRPIAEFVSTCTQA